MDSTNEIRPIALAIVEHDNKILVFHDVDKTKDQGFYRILGGGLNFQETSVKALEREFKEETGAELKNIEFLDVIENIFDYEGRHHHEIVFLYRAEFVNKKLLGNSFIIKDSRHQRPAEWIDKSELKKANFYPNGIEKYI